MQSTVPATGILDFFRNGFEHTAWRLETRREYDADQRTGEYQQFLQGVAPDNDEDSPWYSNTRTQTGQGKRIEGVRLVDEPATANQRYLIATTPGNLTAGEDIRYLYRSAGAAITRICPRAVLADQLDRLMSVNGLSTVELGIIPLTAEGRIGIGDDFWTTTTASSSPRRGTRRCGWTRPTTSPCTRRCGTG
ncbi:DUF6879 family protein [Streptomyces cyaneofuscatus]|uniref:DUF6879 family protein n=1 Tax=Streptomyces cyaneofuscatus TaxID=66883 RepID=UPI0036616764